MRIYTGYIHEVDGDGKYMQGIDLNAPTALYIRGNGSQVQGSSAHISCAMITATPSPSSRIYSLAGHAVTGSIWKRSVDRFADESLRIKTKHRPRGAVSEPTTTTQGGRENENERHQIR